MLLQGRAVHDVGGRGDLHEVPERRHFLSESVCPSVRPFVCLFVF